MSNDTEHRLSAALNGLIGDRPYAPDLDQIESRGRKLRHRRQAWRVTVGGGLTAVAAVAAVAVATGGSGVQAPAPNLAGPKPATAAGTAEGAPLVQLVGYLSTADAPAGDATLVLRDQVFKDGAKTQKVDVWDLFADNGDCYFAKTRGALPAQVRRNHLEPDSAARKKIVAAAQYAAKGDLNEARKRMALAYSTADPIVKPTLEAPGVTPPLSAEAKKKLSYTGQKTGGNFTDNWVWNNSLEALRYGAGSPVVRAGVLRLLGQMPEIKVKKGTLGAQPVLTLTAGAPATLYPETLTINADNGLPIKYAAGAGVINYTVTRVTIADVAKAKF
jgi:hypothetical protein